jgi:hypothetical protein
MRVPRGQKVVKCAHCGKPRNFLSTWVAVHAGRVCYTCVQSGSIQVVPETELEVAIRRLQEELSTCANRLDITFWQSEVLRLGGTL